MLTQFLTSLLNGLADKIVQAFSSWTHIKFYFIACLIFLFSIGLVYRETITMTIQTAVFNEIRFRECRDIMGLSLYMDKVCKRDIIIEAYSIYLYQPINNSTYKKLILSNDLIVMRSPALQGVYLSTQPTINQELTQHDYYLADYREFMSHKDTEFWADFSNHTRLCYRLKLDDKLIGEVWIRFKSPPSPLELEKTLKEISPLMYNYII